MAVKVTVVAKHSGLPRVTYSSMPNSDTTNSGCWTSNRRDKVTRNSSLESFISHLCFCWPSIHYSTHFESWIRLQRSLFCCTSSGLVFFTSGRLGPEPVHETKNGCQDIDPNGSSILSCRESTSFSVIIFRNIQELERIIGNNSIDFFHDTPLHPLFVINCPQKYRASSSFDVAEEFVTKWSHHAFLKHIEVYSRLFQELSSICYAEANMCCAIIWKVFCAQREVVGLVKCQMRERIPASCNYLLSRNQAKFVHSRAAMVLPPLVLLRSTSSHRRRYCRSVLRFSFCSSNKALRITLISSNTQISCSPGSERYSSNSWSRGIGSPGCLIVLRGSISLHAKSIILSFFPKQRSNVGSWDMSEVAHMLLYECDWMLTWDKTTTLSLVR
jgi:hypothetical protein